MDTGNELDNYPAGETDPYEDILSFPDEIMRKVTQPSCVACWLFCHFFIRSLLPVLSAGHTAVKAVVSPSSSTLSSHGHTTHLPECACKKSPQSQLSHPEWLMHSLSILFCASQDILDDLLPHGSRSLPKPPNAPPCWSCACKNVSAVLCSTSPHTQPRATLPYLTLPYLTFAYMCLLCFLSLISFVRAPIIFVSPAQLLPV